MHWIPRAGGGDGLSIKKWFRLAAIAGIDIGLYLVPLLSLYLGHWTSLTVKTPQYTGQT
jgi:hypothetical protein